MIYHSKVNGGGGNTCQPLNLYQSVYSVFDLSDLARLAYCKVCKNIAKSEQSSDTPSGSHQRPYHFN